jgi:hypothetical protein
MDECHGRSVKSELGARFSLSSSSSVWSFRSEGNQLYSLGLLKTLHASYHESHAAYVLLGVTLGSTHPGYSHREPEREPFPLADRMFRS